MRGDGMKTILHIVSLILFFNNFVAAAFVFVPAKKVIYYRHPVVQDRRAIFFARIPEDDDVKGYDDIEKNTLLEPSSSSSSSFRERLKIGNYLDVLQIGVVFFFLLTLWISGGSILSDYSTSSLNNADGQQGKSRVYKYIDADKLLRDEFEKVDSTVIFE